MEVTGANIRTLGIGLSAAFNAGLGEYEPSWNEVATEVPSTTAENDYSWLADWPGMKRWIGDRKIKELAAYGYTLKNEPFESTIAVKREHIEDDNIGLYSTRSNAMGRAAAAWPDEIVWELLPLGLSTLCYDGQNYFDTDHPVTDPETGEAYSVSNYTAGANPGWYLLDTTKPLKPLIFQSRKKPEFTSRDDPNDSDHVFMRNEYLFGTDARGNAGFSYWQLAHMSKAELNEANFDAAYDAMTIIKNDEGRPLKIMANKLVVPPQLRKAADEVIKRSRKANGEDNTNQNIVEVHVAPWLA